MRQTISAQNAPAAIGPYCHAKLAGGCCLPRASWGWTPPRGASGGRGGSGAPEPGEPGRGAVRRRDELWRCGQDHGFLANMEDFGAVNAVYAGYFPDDPPARSCVAVKTLPKGGLVEIEIVAAQG